MEIALALLFPCDRRHERLLLFDGHQGAKNPKKESELEKTRIIILLLITVVDVAWECVGIGSSALFKVRMFASVCYLAYQESTAARTQTTSVCNRWNIVPWSKHKQKFPPEERKTITSGPSRLGQALHGQCWSPAHMVLQIDRLARPMAEVQLIRRQSRQREK